MRKLLDLYPQDPVAGSPFDTGDANQFSSQYKRLAALQVANLLFQLPIFVSVTILFTGRYFLPDPAQSPLPEPRQQAAHFLLS
jgi:hypothetical protein